MEISNELLKTYSKAEILKLSALRKGETKLGEVINTYQPNSSLKKYHEEGLKFALLGIPESVGALANSGRPGAENTWKAFLSFFLNVQHNRFMDPSQILLMGHLQVSSIQEDALAMDPADLAYSVKLRKLCERIDEKVIQVVKSIFEAGLIPIVVGGGHNNAYPLIKAWHQTHGHPAQVINCDPHADFRVLEGRHSGNSFSYAMEQGLLDAYHVLGLHQNYNSEEMLSRMDAHKKVSYSCWEDIADWQEQTNVDLKKMAKNKSAIGIELDMDAIAHMPASAFTPVGINLEQAAYFLKQSAKLKNLAWLHLPEAAPHSEQESREVGKAISYLITDFIKAHA